MEDQKTTEEQPEKNYTVREFFEEIPPGQTVNINNLAKKNGSYVGDNSFLLPDISLYCANEACEGFRWFKIEDTHSLMAESSSHKFIYFVCKNCGKTRKVYSIWVYLNKDRTNGKLYKFGEVPEFGPPTPSKVISILGKEKDYYFKGRRSENQGLGIAAFAYYRRVVENQKNKIFSEIIKTVEKVDPANINLLAELENAKTETQFTKAVDLVKHGIPQALLIDGHNPLTLLHSALSEGLHADTDEECLEIATSIRIVLTDLVERMANAVNDTVELKSAVSRLLQRKNPKK